VISSQITEQKGVKALQLRRILYVQYTNPAAYPPLEHGSQILAKQGWQVLFLGTFTLESNTLTFPSHPNIIERHIPFCAPGWRQKLHYLKFCFWILVWTLRWRPQWIYASDLWACPIANLLLFLPNIKVIYHEHDSPTHQTQSPSLFLQFCLRSRSWLARNAELCILPNQQRIEHWNKVVHIQHPFCVWNCPSKEEVVPSRSPWNGEDLWILYHGSIVPDRLPISVLHALSMLPKKVKLRIIGYETIGHQSYIQQLQDNAVELGIHERVQILNALPRQELLMWCQQSDIGLAFMPMSSEDLNLKTMTGASNKPFDYLACGLPLVVSNLEDWQEMYVKPGYGLACYPNDPESIAAILRWYLEHPIKMRKMGDLGRQRILQEWNYEMQFELVNSVMNASISGL
jgi:glycosyltransferase involved in cell wall biosynthesis